MKNWEIAEHELKYRIKQLKKEIELRSFLIHNATKEYDLDDWYQAERELGRRADFYAMIEERANEIRKSSVIPLSKNGSEFLAENQLISEKAYLIWKNRQNMLSDWYDSENRIRKEITEKALEIQKNQPYLSDEEATYCARDKLHEKIERGAYDKWKWVSYRAYYISQEKPDNSDSDNWYLAAKEYDSKR